MTRDKILALSDEELDRVTMHLTGRVEYTPAIKEQLSQLVDEAGIPVYLPGSPSKDIAAAWKLEETVLAGVVALRICYARALVEFVRVSEICGTALEYEEARDETALALAHASPLNRTRAFVLAMTQEGDSD